MPFPVEASAARLTPDTLKLGKALQRASDENEKYLSTQDVMHLDKKVEAEREAFELCPRGSLRTSILSNLAASLGNRFRRKRNVEDLIETIRMFRETVRLCPPGNPDRGRSLNNLADGLADRFRHTGTLDDLTEAIRLYQQALQLFPPDHWSRNLTLKSLSGTLNARFERMGNIDDLEEAIRICRQLLKTYPPGDLDRSLPLGDLGNYLRKYYKETGDVGHLTKLIKIQCDVLQLRPPGHPHRAATLSSIAFALIDRAIPTGNLCDLSKAFRFHLAALRLRLPGHPDRSNTLNNCAHCLLLISCRTGNLRYLKHVIQIHQEVVHLWPPGHPDRSISLNNMALALSEWLFQVELIRSLYPPSENELSRMETEIFSRLRSITINTMMDRLREATFHPSSSVTIRLSAARTWRGQARDFNHPSELEGMIETLNLLDESLANVRSLKNLCQSLCENRLIRESQGVASDAAALAIEQGDVKLAATLLERGRSMIFAQLRRFRQAPDSLHEAAPEVAQRFTELSDTLNNLIVHGQESEGMRRATGNAFGDLGVIYHQTHTEWVKTTAEIRQIPGFESFLCSPSFDQLQQAAVGGPVILLNINDRRSDAIVVIACGSPIPVPLPDVNPEVVQHLADRLGKRPAECHSEDLLYILREIWRIIAGPVIARLMSPPINLTRGWRIWWCPTGAASRLPLHAAGPYTAGEDNLPCLLFSSYTPTLGALIRARQSGTSGPEQATKSILIVGQPETPGELPLPGVIRELDAIQKRAPRATVLLSSRGTKKAVLAGLQASNWIHLACHGHHHPTQPFLSHFSMHDGPIAVQDIIEKDLPLAELAFLSACHSARASETLPDELLHLTSGMMFAGYKSVIGTMWAFDDNVAGALADQFYRLMLGGKNGPRHHSNSAVALAKAFHELDTTGYKIPLLQRINVVHFGV